MKQKEDPRNRPTHSYRDTTPGKESIIDEQVKNRLSNNDARKVRSPRGRERNRIPSSYNTQEYISNESKNLKFKGKILKLLKDNIRDLTTLKLRGFVHKKIPQSEKTSHKLGENICKTYDQQNLFPEYIKNSSEKRKTTQQKNGQSVDTD